MAVSDSKPQNLLSYGDLLKCCICMSDFRDPRCLPCIHTFCLACLEQMGKDKMPDDEMVCPLCRCEFVIPTGGFAVLPKNFFIAQMTETRGISEPPKDVVCDICSEEGSAAVSATTFCADCKQRMCETCSKYHKRTRVSSSHCLVTLGAPSTDLMSNLVTCCDQHKHNRIELYCTACQEAICVVCHVAGGHKLHDCLDIIQAAAEEGKQLQAIIDRIDQKRANNTTTWNNVDAARNDFVQKISAAEKAVSKCSKERKMLIDKHVVAVYKEITEAKDAALKKVAGVKDEFERQRIMMESYVKYSRELVDNGSPCSVMRCARDLKKRAEELESLKQPTDDTLQSEMDVKFVAADLQSLTPENTVGRLITGSPQHIVLSNEIAEVFVKLSATFSGWMTDQLKGFELTVILDICAKNSVKTTVRKGCLVGVSGSQTGIESTKKTLLELIQNGAETLSQTKERKSLEQRRPICTNDPLSSVDRLRVRIHGVQADVTAQSQGAINQALNTGYTQYLKMEQHIWNYIVYKNCNLIGEFSSKYDCSVSAIPCDYVQGRVKMCKIAISSSNRDELHEVTQEIAELCRVLMAGDIVECAINFPPRDDLEYFQNQLESIDVQVASYSYSLIGPLRSMDLAKSKFEAAVRTLQRSREIAKAGVTQEIACVHDSTAVVPCDLQGDSLRFKTRSGLIVHVRRRNIVEQETEAIVDAANTRLRGRSGVSKAITGAAGKQVEDECRKYIKDHGELKTGKPMHTSAGKLTPPVKHIIHIAGPDSSHYKDKHACHELLQQTFFNCLQYANEQLGVCSISVPAISSGVYGVPKEVVARRTYAALMAYDSRLLENPKLPRKLRDIHFVNIDVETTSVMERVLRELCDGDRCSPSPSPAATKQAKI